MRKMKKFEKEGKKASFNEKEGERVFLKPGKDNKEERLNFIKFWVNYIKTHKDEEWSEQQNIVIDGQIS